MQCGDAKGLECNRFCLLTNFPVIRPTRQQSSFDSSWEQGWFSLRVWKTGEEDVFCYSLVLLFRFASNEISVKWVLRKWWQKEFAALFVLPILHDLRILFRVEIDFLLMWKKNQSPTVEVIECQSLDLVARMFLFFQVPGGGRIGTWN